MLQYVTFQTRSLQRSIRFLAAQTLQCFPFFDSHTLNQILQKEKLENYGKTQNSKKNEIKSTDIEFQGSSSNNSIIGCIIHLLEDEFYDIRNLAILSVGEFCENDQNFRIASKDILLYMLNDENDIVRIQSLKMLKKRFQNLTLKENEIEQLIFNVKENVPELRAAIYELSQNLQINKQNKDLLILLVQSFLQNIQTFKDDRLQIYSSFQKISQNNCETVIACMKEILEVEDIQYVTEPQWNESSHIGKVILIQNAVIFSDDQQIINLPSYFTKHVVYIKEKFQEFFSQKLQIIQQKTQNNNINNYSNQNSNSKNNQNSDKKNSDHKPVLSNSLLKFLKMDVEEKSEDSNKNEQNNGKLI